jgi:hypothetical protein
MNAHKTRLGLPDCINGTSIYNRVRVVNHNGSCLSGVVLNMLWVVVSGVVVNMSASCCRTSRVVSKWAFYLGRFTAVQNW